MTLIETVVDGLSIIDVLIRRCRHNGSDDGKYVQFGMMWCANEFPKLYFYRGTYTINEDDFIEYKPYK